MRRGMWVWTMGILGISSPAWAGGVFWVVPDMGPLTDTLDVIRTVRTDSGYAFLSHLSSGECAVLKVNPDGFTVQWVTRVAAGFTCKAFTELTDGKILLSGHVSDSLTLVALDGYTGQELWTRSYGVSGTPLDVLTLSGGDVLMAGEDPYWGMGIAFRLDAAGTPQWSRTYNTVDNGPVRIVRALQVTDSTFFFLAQRNLYASGLWDAFLFETNAQGEYVAGLPYAILSASGENLLLTGVVPFGNGFVVGGYTTGSSPGFVLLRLDSALNVVWAYRYTLSSGVPLRVYDLMKAPSGFLVGGDLWKSFSSTVPFFAELDTLGQVLRVFALEDTTDASSGVFRGLPVDDSTLLFAGIREILSSGITGYAIAHLPLESALPCETTLTVSRSALSLSVSYGINVYGGGTPSDNPRPVSVESRSAAGHVLCTGTAVEETGQSSGNCGGPARLSVRPGRIVLDHPTRFWIYTLQGRQMVQGYGSLIRLPRGVYVLRLQNTTRSVRVVVP